MKVSVKHSSATMSCCEVLPGRRSPGHCVGVRAEEHFFVFADSHIVQCGAEAPPSRPAGQNKGPPRALRWQEPLEIAQISFVV